MNNLQKDVIKLIKSALTGEKYELSESFDFKAAFDESKRHAVSVMAYYGALNCGIDQSDPVMQEAFMLTCRIVSRSVQQSFEISNIFAQFDKNGIEYMPLKGTLLRNMYPKSEMRSMSDADILIKTGQYEKIKQLMTEIGFEEKGVTDHEYQWLKPTLYAELHSRLIPSYNKDYFAYYGDGWQLGKICDGTRYSMTDEDQMIYLFTHFAKHYRDAGIGLKHIIDLWVYRKNKSELDEQYITRELKKLRLDEFYINITETLSVWFDGRQSNSMTDFITDYIFDCGAAGKKENNVISVMLKSSGQANFKKNAKLKMYWFYVFFPYEKMCMKYPFLKKFPVALPVMWVVRLIAGLLSKEKRNSAKSSVDSIENEKIVERQQGLNYVGLNFNFKE